MRKIVSFEKDKGNLQRGLIGGHISLCTTKETSLGDLRALTTGINRIRIGEGW
jgi:hypothetical protein